MIETGSLVCSRFFQKGPLHSGKCQDHLSRGLSYLRHLLSMWRSSSSTPSFCLDHGAPYPFSKETLCQVVLATCNLDLVLLVMTQSGCRGLSLEGANSHANLTMCTEGPGVMRTTGWHHLQKAEMKTCGLKPDSLQLAKNILWSEINMNKRLYNVFASLFIRLMQNSETSALALFVCNLLWSRFGVSFWLCFHFFPISLEEFLLFSWCCCCPSSPRMHVV